MQVEDPFFRPPPTSAANFLAYRILVPVVANLFGLSAWSGVGLIWFAGFVTLGLIYSYLIKKGLDRKLAFWLVLGFATTSMMQGSLIYIGYPDAVSWLLVALCIYWAKPLLWAPLTFLGLFNDERFLVALPLALAVVLFDQRTDMRRLFSSTVPFALAVFVGTSCALLVRYGIKTGFIGDAPVIGSDLPTSPNFPWLLSRFHVAGLILSFGLLWILPLLAVWFDKQARVYWTLIVVYCVIAVYVTAYVADFWRSLAALYPLFMLSLMALWDAKYQGLNKLLPILVTIKLVLPQIEEMGNQIRWLRPLPVSVLEWYQGESILHRLGIRG
jgi:hypothetical protein